MFAALSDLIRPHAGRADFLTRIDRPGDWVTVSARHGRHTVARTETVKFVIDLHDDRRTYFLNSSKWFSHYGFVQRFIDPHVDYNRFILAEYLREDRRFVLGSVMHYLDGDHWTVELDPSDLLTADWIAWMLGHVAERVTWRPTCGFAP